MKRFLIFGVFFLCLAANLHAAGDLDPLFGNGGKVTTDFLNGDDCHALVLQPDGKIIAAGFINGQDFGLVRYNPNGSLDPTFGNGGKVITDLFGKTDFLGDIQLQTDGKIIAAGLTRVTSPMDPMVIALVRYNPNGSLDPTFGTDGIATASLPNFNFLYLHVSAAIQLDGKIVVVGGASEIGVGPFDGFVARFDPNGSLDSTFGGGIVIVNITAGDDFLNAVAIQVDGKIVAAGQIPGAGGQDHFDFATVRLNPDGGMDPTFGSNGIATLNVAGADDVALGVVIQPDERIVIAGEAESLSPFRLDFGLVRYNPNGSLDPTFGNGGIVTTDFFGGPAHARSIVLQADQKIIAAGLTGVPSDFALARYNPNGSLDPTFGSGGQTVTDFIGLGDAAQDVLIQPDGKIVAAGASDQGGNNAADFALARYNGDIILPPTCGLYSDDFEDGVLAPDWNYVKPDWTEVGGNLEGTPPHGKAEAIATPAFAGCGTGSCTIQTTIQTAGGPSNKIFFFGWYQDKDNLVEVLMKEEQDKWVIKQLSNGSIVAKTKASAIIAPNIFYDVRVAFDGTQFTLIVDGVTLVSMNAGATPSGTVGFRVKKTTGRFGNICAD